MGTIKLYKEDVYLKEAFAVVTSAAEKDGKCLVTLNRTLFFPTGGGQSCDKGTVAGFTVLDVSEKGDEVFHLVDCAISDLPAAGSDTEVELLLDWSHRFDNMQRHCGEHITSGIFYREYGGVNRGFHMGDQYMTIDISLEDDPEYDKITWDMAKHVEYCANQVIWNNAPVITRHFDTREEAANLPLRKKLAIDEDITIVCVGSVDNPADCVACCGTHPATAGQVGMIKIYKVESNKGMFRIYMEAGERAFKKYQMEYDTLNELGNKLSAGTEDIMKKYEAQAEKNREARTQLHLLKKDVIAREVSEIKDSLAQLNCSENPVRHYDLLTLDDLMNVAKELYQDIPKVLFLVHNPSNTILLCSSGNPDCGKLVKENVGIYGGKGGGSKTSARAIFSKAEYIDTFIDLIGKHLR